MMRDQEPRTLGEAVDRYGVCSVMAAVADLAQAVGRIPVGLWDYTFGDWRLRVNGTQKPVAYGPDDPVPPALAPFHGVITHRGLLAALFNPADGIAVGHQEAEVLAALKVELDRVTAGVPARAGE